MPDWLPEYAQRPGLLVNTDGFKAGDFFQLFFTNPVFELMANETNRYADQFFDSGAELLPNSRLRKWIDNPTNASEMKAMVALHIAMGLCKKPSTKDYWQEFWLTHTPGFRDVMPRDRYQLLCTFLHFADNRTMIAHGEEGYNPLHKIQPLIDIVEPRCEEVYSPQQKLSIDEAMIKFKGRIYFRQYLPAKPIKWGIKQFCLCESSTGYRLKNIIYTGKYNAQVDVAGFSTTEKVVIDLLDGFENKGHIVYTDNFYSSPNLFLYLQSIGIGACGTVRATRKLMPEALKPRNLILRRGMDPVFMRHNNLVAVTWHDTNRVSLISTISNNDVIDKDIRTKGIHNGTTTSKK